jgi:hypothetical protein
VLTSNSVNFVEEDETCLLGSGHLEKLPHHSGTLRKRNKYREQGKLTPIQDHIPELILHPEFSNLFKYNLIVTSSGLKFTLYTDLGSASHPPTLTIIGGNSKLTEDQCLGATSPSTNVTHLSHIFLDQL